MPIAMKPFETCRQRIHAARAHRKLIGRLWNRLVKKSLYRPHIEMDTNGRGALLVAPLYGTLLTDKFALHIGELLYQLRAALDACVYDAAILDGGKNPPPNENTLEFPIFLSCKDFLKDEARKLGPLSQERRDFIEFVQPYNAPKIAPELLVWNMQRSLEILNDWARKDRHRRLHVVGSWGSNAKPHIRVPRGTHLRRVKVTQGGFLLDKQNVVATFEIWGLIAPVKIHFNPDLMIDIAVDEVPPPCADTDTLGNRLTAMIQTVHFIVGVMEQSFEKPILIKRRDTLTVKGDTK